MKNITLALFYILDMSKIHYLIKKKDYICLNLQTNIFTFNYKNIAK